MVSISGEISRGEFMKEPRFRGQYSHAMDKKGRVSIPVRFRDTLRKKYDEQLILSVGEGCLVAYPLEEWEELEDSLQKLPRFSPVVKKYKRMLVSTAQECPLDSQGRILVPPELRARGALKDKILFVGMIHYFEVWDRDAYMKKYVPKDGEFSISEIEEEIHKLTEKTRE
jgi:MraZ protein